MYSVLLCMLEAVEGELHLLEVIRCVLLRVLEAVEVALCLLEVLEALNELDVPEVMRCVLLCFRGFEISIVGVYRPPPYLGEELEKLFKTLLKAPYLTVVKFSAGSYLVAERYGTKLEAEDGREVSPNSRAKEGKSGRRYNRAHDNHW